MLTIVDFGSRSIKIYISDCKERGRQTASINWCPLEPGTSDRDVEVALDDVRRHVSRTPSPVLAVGTAVARRSPRLKARIESFCAAQEWPYETLAQERELALVAQAFASAQTGRDVLNAGGGSIQIACADGAHAMLRFGISDLNTRFALSEPPAHRRVDACISWLGDRLPRSRAPFVYTGGEATYLAAMNIPMGPDGRCEAQTFRALAQRLAAMEAEALEQLSPFGPRWMTGAIASNCIVLAALRTRELDHFFASDINVADGVALAYATESLGGLP